MIYPSFPPAPRDPLLSVFLGICKTALVLFLVAVVGFVAAIAISARSTPDAPAMTTFTNQR